MGDDAQGARFNFEKVGLGYRIWPTDPDIDASIRVRRISRSRHELHGLLEVRCNFDGVKTVNGILHLARFNLSSSLTRQNVANLLKKRTPGFEAHWDWFDALETLCQYVEHAETRGEPVVEVGHGETEQRDRYALDPVAPAKVAALLYGPGGVGKSIMALAGALSVATFSEIIPGIKPLIQGSVLYLDWETSSLVVGERIRAICRGAGIKPANILYRRCNRPLADDAEELSALADERDIVMVIIDSCGPAIGTSGEYGDANESTLRLFEAIRFINRTTQIVDHVSKQEMRSRAGKVTGLLPYGSIYKVNLARTAWELRNLTTDDDDELRIALLNTKANDERLHTPIHFRIDWQQDRITFKTDVVETRPTVNARIRGSYREQMRSLLEEEEMAATALAGLVRNPQGLLVKELNETDPTQIIRKILHENPDLFERSPSDPERIRLKPRGLHLDNVVQMPFSASKQ